MKKIALCLVLMFCFACTFFSYSQRSEAVIITGDGIWGDFQADLIYTYNNDLANAQLSVVLINTSPSDNGGFLTAFAFNNPYDRITNVVLYSTDLDFHLFGGSDFSDGIDASPFGYFDIGAGTGKNFNGTGEPDRGIGIGSTETFSFHLYGDGLNDLTVYDFVSELSSGNAGEGNQFFLARFRGFSDGGSNKTLGTLVPEPDSVLLVVSSFLGLIAIKPFTS